jgi:hypothetical protein
MRRPLAITAALLAAASAAHALEVGLHKYAPRGRIRAARTADADGDGRKDLVLLVENPPGDGPATTDLVVLRAPKEPDPKAWFRAADEIRIPCDGPAAGVRARAGAIAVGRFGPKGATRLRFLGPDGAWDVDPMAPTAEPAPAGGPTLFARSPGVGPVFWDGVADLDGDGRDESWWPNASGRLEVPGLSLSVNDEASGTSTVLFSRRSWIPVLVAADMDGDGTRELVRLEGTALVVERPARGGAAATTTRIELPFLAPEPDRPPEELRTPRLSLADVDGDRVTDLLVTVVQGRADKVGGLRTALYHVPGPILDPATGAVRPARGRIDTESVALHPAFVDVDGDGARDYVADSIRGTTLDLVRRVMGAEPEITFTAFRFDRAAGTFERSPFTTVVRPYSSAQARGNTFGRSGFFEGDFDGDGARDLLDLGNLTGLSVWRGGGSEGAFSQPLVRPVPIDKDRALAPDAVLDDLNGDGRTDAAVWSDDALYLVVSKGAR